MKQRSSLLKNAVVRRAALCGLAAGLVLPAVGSVGQTPDQLPMKTPPKQVKTPPDLPKTLPGNPLVLGDAGSNVPPPHQDVPKNEFRDYRDRQGAGPTNARQSKDLPLFGYDYWWA